VPSAPTPTITVTFGDQTLPVNLSVTNTQTQNYRQFQFSNVTTATAAELTFDTAGGLSQTQYVNFLVDDVVVTSVVSAVPEPSALALGMTGLAGLALWRRRSPQRQA
jgi:MYXO-CTERM domain-containing protein